MTERPKDRPVRYNETAKDKLKHLKEIFESAEFNKLEDRSLTNLYLNV